MTASVVIPAFNGQSHLAANLPAVLALNADEVIVVDDASADGSADFVADHFREHLGGGRMDSPEVKLIRHHKNTGFPIAVNDGFTAASGDIIFLLNQDAAPAPDLIPATLPLFTRSRLFAVTFNDGRHGFAQASIKAGFIEYQNGPRQRSQYQSFWANGGSSAFRRQTWLDLGGFDPAFSPGYFEDLDLCWRARKMGWQILWAKAAKVAHPHPGSTFQKIFSPRRLQRIKDRNFLMCHWKNLDPGEFPAHIASLLSRVLVHPGYLVPVFMALRHLTSLLSSRHPAQLSNAQVFAKFT